MNNSEGDNLPFVFMLADDDEDDIMLMQDAMDTAGIEHEMLIVNDGKSLIDYLLKDAATGDTSKTPSLILLDLNMPVMDGREALKYIKSHDELKTIPVVVLSTSNDSHDIVQMYANGAAGYFAKPSSFSELVDLMKTLNNYWYQLAQIPHVDGTE